MLLAFVFRFFLHIKYSKAVIVCGDEAIASFNGCLSNLNTSGQSSSYLAQFFKLNVGFLVMVLNELYKYMNVYPCLHLTAVGGKKGGKHGCAP